jgi:DNA-binding response OmpR family regulator
VARARAELAAGRYTLAALDIMLPGESGVEVAVDILKNHPGVQFLFISAMNRGAFLETHSQQIAAWPKLAQAQYLMKPFSLDYFISVVKKTAAPKLPTHGINRIG